MFFLHADLTTTLVSADITQFNEQGISPATINQPPRGILHNPTFDDGLRPWTPKGCKADLTGSLGDILPVSERQFAVATNRTESWQGIEQDITGRIEESTLYHVTAMVRLHGGVNEARVLATLYMTGEDGKDQYLTLGR